ncbi:hypothetical protein ES703_23155 [subsurface metagenome]
MDNLARLRSSLEGMTMPELRLVQELLEFLAKVQRLCEGGDGEYPPLSGTIVSPIDNC